MEPIIFTKQVEEEVLRALLEEWYSTLVKGVADIEQEIIALGGEWHMDANNVLMQNGSSQENLWGFNLYPNRQGNERLEYTSLVNIRPAQGNMDMEIEDEEIRDKIQLLAEKFVPYTIE